MSIFSSNFDNKEFDMKFLIVLSAMVVASQGASLMNFNLQEWVSFKETHSKTYQHQQEESMRLGIFMKNHRHIREHNARYSQGLETYYLGINKYADMEHSEFVATFNGFNKSRVAPSGQRRDATYLEPALVEVPESVDWREHGAVTPVKDQGQCGSCWSFSATGSLEGQHFRKTGKLVSLSEQNLVDCSGRYGNNGCEGGLMDAAFRYIRDNDGLDTEKSYPYEARDDRCRYSKANEGADDTGFVDVQRGSEDKLKSAVATVGPISVAMDAGHRSFQLYAGGVYVEPECSSTFLDHGVLAVGYGSENGKDYWLVKNSWGTSWGEDGYLKIARNHNNHCGLATQASYPLV